MNKFLLIVFLFPFLSFSQGQNEKFKYYENGNIKSCIREIDSTFVEIINYSINGLVIDSIRFKNEQPIGGFSKYINSGRLKSTIRSIGNDTIEYINYSPTGQLLDSIVLKNNIPFGVKKDYYSNGVVKEHINYLDSNLIQVNEYEINGNLRDSLFVKDSVTFGIGYRYYKNGNLKYYINYKNNEQLDYVKYRSNGTMRSSGSKYNYKSIGIYKSYNRKGQVIRSQDMFKGEITTIPYKYKNGKHISNSQLKIRFSDKTAFLQDKNQSIKLKAGSIVSLKLKSDSTVKHNYIIEGFSQDSILFSCFNYNFSKNKSKLIFDSTYIVAIDKIETIYFAKNNYNSARNIAILISITGFLLVTESLILVPIIGNLSLFSDPLIIGYLVSGPPLYIWGRHLHKLNVPKPYNTEQWKLNINQFPDTGI